MSQQPAQRASQGFSIIEVLIAIVLLSLMITPFVLSLSRIDNYYTKLSKLSQAVYMTKSNLEITTNILQLDDGWESIFIGQSVARDAIYHVSDVSGEWQYLPGTITSDGYATSIIFSNVCRKIDTHLITPCTGDDTTEYLDGASVRAVSTTTWDFQGKEDQVVMETIYTQNF